MFEMPDLGPTPGPDDDVEQRPGVYLIDVQDAFRLVAHFSTQLITGDRWVAHQSRGFLGIDRKKLEVFRAVVVRPADPFDADVLEAGQFKHPMAVLLAQETH